MGVVLYGPDLDAPHRNGGVAVWLQYLMESCRVAGLSAQFVYIDRPFVDRLPIPRVVKRLIGSLLAAVDILRMPADATGPVVHVNSSLYSSTVLRDAPVVAAAALCGFPVLLQVHGGRLSYLTRGSLSWRVWHWMCRRAACLGIHPGPQWDEFQKAGYAHKMRPMYNFVPSTDHTAQVRGTPAHFLFLGRVVEAKGIKMALETFGRLHEEGHNDIRMTVAGDGELLEHLRSEVNEASYSEAVSFEGFVQGEELEKVRRRANVFLLPSKHEGFPFSFLECAERGMACIVTTNSAIPDAFEAGVEFEPVDPKDQADLYEQMKRMIIDPAHREQIAKAGQEAVRSCCTIEGASDRLRSMYREINEKA